MEKNQTKKIDKFLVIMLLILWTVILGILVMMFLKSNSKKQDVSIVETLPPLVEKKPEVYKLSLIMAGDVLIHSSIYKEAKVNEFSYDFTSMLEHIAPIIGEYDLAFCNQETIIGGKDMGLSDYPRFNSPEEIGENLIDIGFNIFSLANNHSLDRGEQAILNSVNFWKDKDVLTSGTYDSFEERNSHKILTKNNITYTMLSYTTLLNGLKIPSGKDYLVNLYDEETVKNDIESIRDKVDVLMVSMHWGTEYTNTPIAEQREIAQYLAGLGVDIIIGTHPHVVEPIEFIDNTMVIYSLGNFFSAQEGVNQLTGLLAAVEITKTIDDGNITITFDNYRAELIYTYHKNFKNYKLYPYSMLDNSILYNYQNHYETYMNIVTKNTDKVFRVPLEGE